MYGTVNCMLAVVCTPAHPACVLYGSAAASHPRLGEQALNLDGVTQGASGDDPYLHTMSPQLSAQAVMRRSRVVVPQHT